MLADSLIILVICGALLAGLATLTKPDAARWQAQNVLLGQRHKAAELAAQQAAHQLAHAQKKYQTKLSALERDLKTLRQERERIAQEASRAKQDLARQKSQPSQELKMRQELLNLKGDLSRVVFVIDISGSMNQKSEQNMPRANWDQGTEPWPHVQKQVATWLEHLPVESFRIVCFNHEVKQFPAKQTVWLKGQDGRRQAADFFRTQKPSGGTNTEQALHEALALAPSAVILFTDGAPTKAAQQEFTYDQDQVDRILAHLQKRRNRIPINVVAVNNYFNEQLGGFLHQIASSTGGGWIGL
jgi:Mg-chelatase subunit ChlD